MNRFFRDTRKFGNSTRKDWQKFNSASLRLGGEMFFGALFMEAQMEKEYMKGGEFLIADTAEIFTPEDFTEEHRMIADTTREFVDNEVRPNIEAM
jgi:hypothetical protein